MKTSIIVPDALHRAVQDLDNEIAFGEFVRDALLQALPGWEADAAKGPEILELRMKLRAAQANADRAGLARVRQQRKPRARQDQPAPAAPEPATPPARPRAGGKRSATKAAAAVPHAIPDKRTPARSRRS